MTEPFELIICQHFITYSKCLTKIGATFYRCSNEGGNIIEGPFLRSIPYKGKIHVFSYVCF
jgi:hypothetical protein